MAETFQQIKLIHKPELDGLRGIAILLVLIWHYCIVILDKADFNTFQLLTASSLKWTWSGVDLFFVLSGFLIGSSLIENKGSKSFFSTFYIRRVFRILPIYLLSVIAFFIFYGTDARTGFPWLFNGPKPVFSYILFIQNFFMWDGFGANWLGITWSLAIEEQFYLLLPCLIYFLTPKKMISLSVVGIIIAIILRLALSRFNPYVLLFTRMDALLLGLLIAYIYKSEQILSKLGEYKQLILAVASLLLILIVMLTVKGQGKLGGVSIHLVLAFFYGCTLLLCLLPGNSIVKKICCNHILMYTGKISYGIYIYHQLVLGFLFSLLLKSDPVVNDISTLGVSGLCIIAVYLIATLSFYLFERPLLAIGRKFKY